MMENKEVLLEVNNLKVYYPVKGSTIFSKKEYVKAVERKLRRNPEYIIQLLEENLDTKERVLNRIKRCNGIKWYRYLDMSNPVIQWVNENLEG